MKRGCIFAINTHMRPQLPEQLEDVLRPLFDLLPLDNAMGRLVVDGRGDADTPPAAALDVVSDLLRKPELRGKDELAAGLWLYVDELDQSHTFSQSIHTPSGSFWHAIMHRREGDFSNSLYWYRKAGHHPAMARIDLSGGTGGAGTDVGRYDPLELVSRVERAHAQGSTGNPADLVALQRNEWAALFEYCADKG